MAQTLQSDFRNPATDLEREIAALDPWFHNLHLPGGVQTAPNHPLGDFPRFKWEEIAPHIPANLSGWTALDVGCNAGFYSFELARRGADVTAVDADPRYLRQARWAASKIDPPRPVRFREMQVYDLARAGDRFDLVWFMGVFYHLRYPLLALDILSQCTRRLLVFQTLTMPGDSTGDVPDNLPLDRRIELRNEGWPAMAFIEKQLAGDPTNWWVPNLSCTEALLRSSGFSVIARPGHEIFVCQPADQPRAQRTLIDEQLAAATEIQRKENSS